MQLFRKYLKHGLAGLFIFLMMCAAVPYVYATESSQSKLDELEEQRQNTIDEINDLKDSIDDVQKEIDNLKVEKNTIQSYINQLDKQMNALTSEIAGFETKIEEKITVGYLKEFPELSGKFSVHFCKSADGVGALE